MRQKTREHRVQHTQRLNFTTYKRLVHAADAAKRSLSAEIELRIERSLREEGEKAA